MVGFGFLLGAQSDRPVSSFFDYGALMKCNAPYWTDTAKNVH
ncbi:hypothetical protein [Okeania sp. SIO2C2]|nr:hypothetical protein [Okeania sp. SIO2C2]